MKNIRKIVKSGFICATLAFSVTTVTANNTLVESDIEASRFLTQATFGPTTQSIQMLQALGSYESWINNQLDEPVSLIAPKLQSLNLDKVIDTYRQAIWWEHVILNEDQLRQRLTYALSEILVIGTASGFSNRVIEREHYYDLLAKNAFGNFRDILTDVTLNPIMGRYLSMLNNKKANALKNTHPDENYAREIMQLFTIGLVKLKNNGKPKKRNDQAIATYTQDDVVNLARVFTGWSLSTKNNWLDPMICKTTFHDYEEKILLGQTILAGLSCEEDMKVALDILFNHPNTPMFIAKQLIQRFTTSNPSGKYVRAVANKFKDNGSGVRGDLKAVIKEILLHDEARKERRNREIFGKIKEPIIRIAGLFRATEALKIKEYTEVYSLTRSIGQTHLDAPSVFNYFSPNYAPKAIVRDRKTLAPELQLATDKNIANINNYYAQLFRWINQDQAKRITLFLDEELDLVKNTPMAFIEHFNLLLFAGKMSNNTKDVIFDHIINIPYYDDYSDEKIELITKKRAEEALFLMINAPEQNYIQ